MAAVSAPPSADQAADLMKNLAVDSQTKTHDSAEVPKKTSSVQYGSANGEAQNMQVPPRESSLTPLLQEVNQVTDMGMCYLPSAYPSGYVYGGYRVSSDWEDYSRYMNQEGVEMSSGIYSDMYHGYGYPPYGSYPTPGSPLPTMGHDGQLYGPQHYQYPTSYYQAPAPHPTSYAPGQSPISRGDVSTSAAADLPLVSADLDKSSQNGSAKANANGSNMSVPLKPIHNKLSVATKGAHGRGTMPGGVPTSGYPDPRYGYDGMISSMPWYDTSVFSAGQHRPATTSSVSYRASRTGNNPVRSQSQYQLPHYMGLNSLRPAQGMGSAAPGYLNKMYPNSRFYGQFGNNYRTAYGYGPNGYDSRINGRWSMTTDSKYKTRGRGNGFYGYGGENPESYSELNIGPRAGRFRNLKAFGTNAVTPKEENSSTVADEDANGTLLDKEQYNREDFPDHHLDAKFFIIKSYSEDDVHRSIKYNVWASTPNGNGKLDAAFREAQEKAGGCPVFLFFSVNTSGQFIGAAEMVGPVDFQKTQDYWQQDKWFGCFPVKWHIVKDVPNSILKHITLENNDNKPVTNSRDTQEVKLEQGNQLLKLFKEHVSKTSILDDFDFYETRQKLMQERKAKQKQFQKQDLDGKTNDALVNNKVEDVKDATARPEKPLESTSVLNKESTNGEPEKLKVSDEDGGMGTGVARKDAEPEKLKVSDEDGGMGTGDSPKDAEPVTENTAEGAAANGC